MDCRLQASGAVCNTGGGGSSGRRGGRRFGAGAREQGGAPRLICAVGSSTASMMCSQPSQALCEDMMGALLAGQPPVATTCRAQGVQAGWLVGHTQQGSQAWAAGRQGQKQRPGGGAQRLCGCYGRRRQAAGSPMVGAVRGKQAGRQAGTALQATALPRCAKPWRAHRHGAVVKGDREVLLHGAPQGGEDAVGALLRCQLADVVRAANDFCVCGGGGAGFEGKEGPRHAAGSLHMRRRRAHRPQPTATLPQPCQAAACARRLGGGPHPSGS